MLDLIEPFLGESLEGFSFGEVVAYESVCVFDRAFVGRAVGVSEVDFGAGIFRELDVVKELGAIVQGQGFCAAHFSNSALKLNADEAGFFASEFSEH